MKRLTHLHAQLVGFNKVPEYDRIFKKQQEVKRAQTPEEMMAVMAGLK